MASLDFVEDEVAQDLSGILRVYRFILFELLGQLDYLLSYKRAHILDDSLLLRHLQLLVPSLIQLRLQVFQFRILSKQVVLKLLDFVMHLLVVRLDLEQCFFAWTLFDFRVESMIFPQDLFKFLFDLV